MMFMHSMSNSFPKFYYVLAVILNIYYENVLPDYFCLFSTFPVSRHVCEVSLHVGLSFSSQRSLLQQDDRSPDCWTQTDVCAPLISWDFANTRGAQNGHHQCPGTSDDSQLLLEQCWPKCPLVCIFLAPWVYSKGLF